VTYPDLRRALVVTFDGGFDSVRTLAFPVLRRSAIRATVYVPTA